MLPITLMIAFRSLIATAHSSPNWVLKAAATDNYMNQRCCCRFFGQCLCCRYYQSSHSEVFPVISGLPVANFTSNVTSGKDPLTVQFTDLSTNATSWYWDFGDGFNSTEQNPIHTYSTAGNYTVNLTAINGNGKDSKLATITVEAVPEKPIASFSETPTSGNAPVTVNFTDTSTGIPTWWKWSFGDGIYSTQQNPVHTYNRVGKYTVNLIVGNNYGINYVTKQN